MKKSLQGSECKSFHFKRLKRTLGILRKLGLSPFISKSIASSFITFCYCTHSDLMAVLLRGLIVDAMLLKNPRVRKLNLTKAKRLEHSENTI